MTKITPAAKDRRGRSQELVAKLVEERTQMLALYCRLAGVDPYSIGKSGQRRPQHTPQQVEKLLQEFCQILVDYIAAGHFALYERIVEGTERRRDVSLLAEQLYPRIAESTDLALDFNDKYDSEDHKLVLDKLHDDLSRLGEQLAARIDMEDKLIAGLISR